MLAKFTKFIVKLHQIWTCQCHGHGDCPVLIALIIALME